MDGSGYGCANMCCVSLYSYVLLFLPCVCACCVLNVCVVCGVFNVWLDVLCVVCLECILVSCECCVFWVCGVVCRLQLLVLSMLLCILYVLSSVFPVLVVRAV